jgi:hypothetical protein
MKPKQQRMPQASESIEQMYLFRWALYQECKYPELMLLYHIPNGGKRDIATAKRLKAEGVKSGVPDLCLPVSRGGYHGLYIELKVNDNTTTDNQKRWIAALSKQGYSTAVCYGWEEASKTIEDYLNNKTKH